MNKFLEFEKQLRDLAKSKGVQPRTFLEQLVKQKPEFAHNKIIQKLCKSVSLLKKLSGS